MFKIFYDGKLIGTSALEEGDPPMGCAEGAAFPHGEFQKFRATVSPERDNDPSIKRWIGLTITTMDEKLIECIDVVLFEYDFGEWKELRVDVVGIPNPLYEELFSGRYAEYATSIAPKSV